MGPAKLACSRPSRQPSSQGRASVFSPLPEQIKSGTLDQYPRQPCRWRRRDSHLFSMFDEGRLSPLPSEPRNHDFFSMFKRPAWALIAECGKQATSEVAASLLLSGSPGLLLRRSPQLPNCFPDSRGLLRFRIGFQIRLQVARRRFLLTKNFVNPRPLQINLGNPFVAQLPRRRQLLLRIREVSLPLAGVLLLDPYLHQRQAPQKMRCCIGRRKT